MAPAKQVRRLRPAGEPPSDPPSNFFTVHEGDTRELERHLAPHSSREHPLITTTVTSPPYSGLKNYGHPRQIGWDQPHDEYLIDLRRAWRTIYDHTRTDGSLWIIADTVRPPATGLRRLVPLPFEIASEAESAGWVLRDIVIWEKNKTLPWSSRGRLRNAFEYVLFFVKSADFKYHVSRLREPSDLREWWVKYPERYNPEGKAPTNIWYAPIPVQGSWANTAMQHACPLPPDLVERMILLTSDPGDVVLDPFAGSGVVVAEAERLGRRGLGVELSPEYVAAFHATVRPEVTHRRGADLVATRAAASAKLQETILRLRALKYPKALMSGVSKDEAGLPSPLAAAVLPRMLPKGSRSNELVAADIVFVFAEADSPRYEAYIAAARRASRRRPASKFGVVGEICAVPESDLGRLMRGRAFYVYRDGRTYSSSGIIRCNELRREIGASRKPPIVSTIEIDVDPREARRSPLVALNQRAVGFDAPDVRVNGA